VSADPTNFRRVTRPPESDTQDAILEVVLQLIDDEGYDAVQLREVARRAHVSLATIYKHFATREDLIFAALERWREANVYVGLDEPVPGESLYDGLMRVFRHIFEPWEREPRMLEAFHRVLIMPSGDRLEAEGTLVVRPVMQALFQGQDPDFVSDVLLITEHVMYGAVGRFVDGKLAVEDILPLIERAVFRLTVDRDTSEPSASSASSASSVSSVPKRR